MMTYVKNWTVWIRDAPEEVLTDALTYWSTLARNWSKGLYSVSADQIKTLVEFQRGCKANGIDRAKFLSLTKEL